MATTYLINRTQVGTRTYYPGTLVDDAVDPAADITAAGGRLYPSANATVAAAAAIAQALTASGQHGKAEGVMLAAASQADVLGVDTATAANATPAIVSATATNQSATATNQSEQRSNHVRYTNVPAADLVSIVAVLDPIADGALVLAGQPSVPCKLQIDIVDGDNSVTGDLVLAGIGASGQGVGQTIPLTGGTRTVVTADGYAVVSSATLQNVAGAAPGDTISIGVSAHLALPGTRSPAAANFVIYKADANEANEAVGTVDGTAGTVSPTTAPNGTNDYDFWYRYSVAVVQDAHNHLQDAHGHTQAAHSHVITLS